MADISTFLAKGHLPPDGVIVSHADRLRVLSADTGVSEVRLAKRLLELTRDPAALGHWPVQLGRVARLAEVRRGRRSGRAVWRVG